MKKAEHSKAQLEALMSKVRRMAFRYGEKGRIGVLDEDDVCQEVMVKLLCNGGLPGAHWLGLAVRSAAADFGRAAARNARVKDRLYQGFSECGGKLPTDCVVQEETRDIYLMSSLSDMLGQLSPVLKQVLVLCGEGFSYEEIARLTNANLGTVRSRLHYARKRARDLLGDDIE
jgi:RNA polymerase sigma-70 factor, ECF subfamily